MSDRDNSGLYRCRTDSILLDKDTEQIHELFLMVYGTNQMVILIGNGEYSRSHQIPSFSNAIKK